MKKPHCGCCAAVDRVYCKTRAGPPCRKDAYALRGGGACDACGPGHELAGQQTDRTANGTVTNEGQDVREDILPVSVFGMARMPGRIIIVCRSSPRYLRRCR